MSRSNGPAAPPPNRWPERPQGQAAPYPDQGYQQPFGGQHQQGFGAPAQPPQQQYAPYPAQPQHQPQPQQQPAYHYPDLGHGGDSYSQPTLGNPAQPAPSYAPQFEPYAPPPARGPALPPQDRFPPAAPQQHGWGGAPEPAYQQFDPVTQPTQPPHRTRDPRIVSHEPAFAPAPPPAPAPEWPPAPQLRGATYDQHPGWPAEPQSHAAPAYGDGYSSPQQPDYGAQDGYAQQGYGQQAAEWPPQQQGFGSPGYPAAEQQAYGHGGYSDPAGYGVGYGEPAGYESQQHGYAPPQFGHPEQQARPGGEVYGAAVPAGDVEDYDHEEMEYEDDRRGGRGRMVMIAAALVGAIGIGGGLAYGYKTLFSGSSGDTPVVRSQSEPSKIKPLDPGGKKFAHTDSKILGRLDSGSDSSARPAPSATSQSASSTDDDGAPRKVTTMVVGRDGSIVPAVASPPPGVGASTVSEPAPAAPPPQRVAGVPGLTIVDGFGGRPPAPVASPPPAARVVPVAPVAPAAPVVLTRPNPPPAIAKPTVIARAAPEPKAEEPDLAEAVAKPAAKKVVKKPANDAFGGAGTAVAAATPAAASDAGSGGAAGYVAVLVSIPTSPHSRMDALKQFADLQQRYPGQLNSKSPEVQSANLAGKGSFDRLIAGPPGSRQQANDLCAQLKTAGYASCWVKSY